MATSKGKEKVSQCRYLLVNGSTCHRESEVGKLFCKLCRSKTGLYGVTIKRDGEPVSKELLQRVKFPVYYHPIKKVLLVNAGGTTQVLGRWEEGIFTPREEQEDIKK